ncbi:MAG: hypothetical protein OEU92_28620, partial [Alphaproteobacteria bacterium]|nr:hypothetical protein [Alphaproteobacteria bacterium]
MSDTKCVTRERIIISFLPPLVLMYRPILLGIHNTPARISEGVRLDRLQREAGHSGESTMANNQDQTLSQRVQRYQPSKSGLFWAFAGGAILATVVGFSWGGWVTGGSAQKMADEKAAQARQAMASIVCVDRFMAASDAGVQLTALKEITSSYQQAKFVADGGWAVIMPVSD